MAHIVQVRRVPVDPVRQNFLAAGMAEAAQRMRAVPMEGAVSVTRPNGVVAGYAEKMASRPLGYEPQRTPGASVARRVVQAEAELPVNLSAFGRQVTRIPALAGLAGSGCTSTGATAAAAVLGAGTAIGQSYASGQIGSGVQAASTTQTSAMVDGKTPSASTTPAPLTTAQKAGLATSIIGTVVTSIYGAVCTARGSDNITNAANIGAGTTSATLTAIQQARAGTAVQSATPATTTTTTTTSSGDVAQNQVASDDKKMLYIGGGIVALGLFAIVLLKD